jgi:hypothetical protein
MPLLVMQDIAVLAGLVTAILAVFLALRLTRSRSTG